MATGLSTQLAKQVGEYLVAAELARRGLMTATFSGNVPDYDIVAVDSNGSSAPVQVKAIRDGAWQFDIRRFVDVRLDGQKQVVGQPVPVRMLRLTCVMVALSVYGEDRFYVLSWQALQDLVIDRYVKYLEVRGGIRPKRFDSFHTAVVETQLHAYRDAWLPELRDRLGLILSDA